MTVGRRSSAVGAVVVNNPYDPRAAKRCACCGRPFVPVVETTALEPEEDTAAPPPKRRRKRPEVRGGLKVS